MADPKLDFPEPLPIPDNDAGAIPSPEERGTEELVIAVVGPIGSGVSQCAQLIQSELVEHYGYRTEPIKKASELIERYAQRVGVHFDPTRPFEKTEGLQMAGTKLREKYGPTVVVDLAIGEISAKRPPKTALVGGKETPVPAQSRRHATIIDAVKNPAEVRRLKAVYKSAFWLVGVFAPEEKDFDDCKIAS